MDPALKFICNKHLAFSIYTISHDTEEGLSDIF